MRRADDAKFTKTTNLIIAITLTLVAVLVVVLFYGFLVSKDYIDPISVGTNKEIESTPQVIIDNTNNISTTASPTVEVSQTATPETEECNVINIAVFGMDNRYKKTIVGGRSDVNIILTIDKTNKSIRITSFMRDLLVYLPSKSDYNRINAAIVYEDDGPAGAVKVIENEFGIEIDHYIVTSFAGMAKIIDTIGGIDLDLTWNNIWEMNGLIQEMNPLFGNRTNSNMLSSPGNVHVNGIQAVAYARIRHADGGFARDSKQKEVLYAAKEQLKDISLSQLNQLLEDVSDYVEMDMNFIEFTEVAASLYQYKDGGYSTLRIPIDGYYSETRYEGMSVLKYDNEYTRDVLYKYIYFNIEP